jgi:hypothetical protein
MPPTGPAPVVPERRGGPVRRTFRHWHAAWKSYVCGYPEQFVEPPLGYYIYETFGMMKAKADPHDFILYRSDFHDGSSALSPAGAQKLSLMASRLPGWLGPVLVEWTPERPELAESRRMAVLALFQQAGMPLVNERVVVAASPFPGLPGADAANNFDTLMLRDQAAPRSYSVTPTSTATLGGGAR